MLIQHRHLYLQWVLAMTALLCLGMSGQAEAADNPPELAPMIAPLDQAEALLANGTYVNGEFAGSVSQQDAKRFAKEIRAKLRLAKTEYSRLPRAIRLSAAADTQWYRMDAMQKASKEFDGALQRHARAGAASPAKASSVTAMKPAPSQPAKSTANPPPAAPQAPAKIAVPEKKPQRAEPTGPDWNNSFIPNIAELKSRDGFFQWPWSQPSWQAVLDKAASEQEKGSLGSSQVKLFTDFVVESMAIWPPVSRLEEAGDAQYFLDMVRSRESADGLEIVDLWMSRGNWKIQRNSLGVILSRTKPGYMLYKDPSGHGCILKQMWVKEAYAGGSNYEKATGWRYAKLRFQSCDHR